MELYNEDRQALLGDEAEAVVPPSLLASAPVVDIGFHPSLPIMAAGLVSGEVEIYEYRGNEIAKKTLENDFSSWIFGKNKHYSAEEVVVDQHRGNVRMHPRGGISAVEFTDDGSYLVTASSDKTVSVLDCVTGKLVIHITDDATDGKHDVLKKKAQPRPKTMTTAKSARVLKKRPRAAGEAARPVNPHKYGISALNVCDENLVATGDDDGLIAVWDMRTRHPAHTYHEHADYVSQICYFYDTMDLVSSSGDTCLGVYDLKAGKVRDFSEKRKDELTCFAYINSSGANNSTFIPSIVCGTPVGGLPMWKYGSWARPYDLIDRHPHECDAIVSFNNPESIFNNNVILTGACDGLVRVIQMYPVRRNLCQLSARDYTYSHANALGVGGSQHHYHNSNYIIKKQRGMEGISRMRVSHDNNILAVSGQDHIIDFVDIRFLNDEKQLDALRGEAERRHMSVLRQMEQDAIEDRAEEEALQERLARGDGSDSNSSTGNDFGSDDDDDDDVSSVSVTTSEDDDDSNDNTGKNEKAEDLLAKFNKKVQAKKQAKEEEKAKLEARKRARADDPEELEKRRQEAMEKYHSERQKKRERVAATKWLKEEKRKKMNFNFEKRRRRVGGFFGDMVNQNSDSDDSSDD